LAAVAAFLVCGVTAFYTHRAEHGRTSDERSAYFLGESAGAEAAKAGLRTLPNAMALNEMAQEKLDRVMKIEQPEAWKQAWKQAFENGYEAAFNQTHSAH
jgi:hypothetical protein